MEREVEIYIGISERNFYSCICFGIDGLARNALLFNDELMYQVILFLLVSIFTYALQ